MAAHDYDTQAFLSVLPEPLQEALERLDRFDELVEVVLDLGRVPEARFEFDFVSLSESRVTKTSTSSSGKSENSTVTTGAESNRRCIAFPPSGTGTTTWSD
jgi:stage III sporulation protein SpoIIIAA